MKLFIAARFPGLLRTLFHVNAGAAAHHSIEFIFRRQLGLAYEGVLIDTAWSHDIVLAKLSRAARVSSNR
jgi:hypothetical protein